MHIYILYQNVTYMYVHMTDSTHAHNILKLLLECVKLSIKQTTVYIHTWYLLALLNIKFMMSYICSYVSVILLAGCNNDNVAL